MQTNNKINVGIVASSLAGGGAERTSAKLSQILEGFGFQVHVITVLSGEDFKFSGQRFDLGILKAKGTPIFGRLQRLIAFKKYLKKHDISIVVDSRSRPTFIKEWLINKLVYTKLNVVYWVHNYNTETYIPKARFLARLIYKSDTNFITVSQAINEKIKQNYGFTNVTTIYNAFDKDFLNYPADVNLNLPEQYILYFGRLVNKSKNITLLLNAYSQSKLPMQNVKLVILGDGEDKVELQQLASALKLEEDVLFYNFTKAPAKFIKDAKYTVLTSRYEGFPMVLLESLSMGTPVVSVDCQSGPSEIIVDKQNGLLVENFNTETLAVALNTFIFDTDLYSACKASAKSSVSHLSEEVIGAQWSNYLKRINETN